MIDPKIRKDIPDQEIRPAKGLSDGEQDCRSNRQAKVAQENEMLILPLVQRTGGDEVVHALQPSIRLALALAFDLLLVAVMTGHVGRQIYQPATQLLSYQTSSGVNGRLLDKLGKLVDHATIMGCILAACGWYEDHVTIQVAGCLVVLAMRDLPGEVRDQQGRVQDPSDSVVQLLRWGERLVTTLVGDDPEASAKETLDEGVQGPETSSHGKGGNCLRRHVIVEDGERGR